MGYDLNRFKEPIRPDLICCVCRKVPEAPVQAKGCLSIFCDKCIHDWLQTNSTCPEEGQLLDASLLLKMPQEVVDLINDLEICCNVCQVIVMVRDLKDHEKRCIFSEKLNEEETLSSLASPSTIIKKLTDENDLLRNELEESKAKVMKIKEEKAFLIKELSYYKGKEFERDEYEDEREMNQWNDRAPIFLETLNVEKETQTDAEKPPPGEVLFLSSREHYERVMKMNSKRLIRSEKLFNVMLAIDGKNFFPPQKQCDELSLYANYIKTIAVHLKAGLKILVVTRWCSTYPLLCLALIVGGKGSVYAFIEREEEREEVEKDHHYFLTSRRLTLLMQPNIKKHRKGCPHLAPFGLIVGHSALSASDLSKLGNQLASGGNVVDWATGEVLFVK